MPCKDHMDDEPRTIYESRICPRDHEDYRDRIKFLEAGLCAVLSELNRMDCVNTVIVKANTNGGIDLTDFWLAHCKSDRARLTRELRKFSKDEREMMMKILKEAG